MRLNPQLQAELEAKSSKTVRVNPSAFHARTQATRTVSPTRRKYRSEPVYVDESGGIVPSNWPGPKRKVADSKREYRRLLYLEELQRQGVISRLRTQVRFCLHGPSGKVLSRYWADFTYVQGGRFVVEDAKGFKTAVYKLKKAWLADEYGFEIREV